MVAPVLLIEITLEFGYPLPTIADAGKARLFSHIEQDITVPGRSSRQFGRSLTVGWAHAVTSVRVAKERAQKYH
jgi:hypothetical protein